MPLRRGTPAHDAGRAPQGMRHHLATASEAGGLAEIWGALAPGPAYSPNPTADAGVPGESTVPVAQRSGERARCVSDGRDHARHPGSDVRPLRALAHRSRPVRAAPSMARFGPVQRRADR